MNCDISHIQISEKIEGGFSNNLSKITVGSNVYILRLPKEKMPPEDFRKILEVSKCAASCKIAPLVIGEDLEHQCLLLEWIDHLPWPTYEENAKPYKSAMTALRCFHDNMPKEEGDSYAPFNLIFKGGEELVDVPAHFSSALEKVAIIFEGSKPWLEKHAVLCHGDFHKNNTLLPNDSDRELVLIDFDSLHLGDPLFDVVKFSVSLSKKYRLELFQEYLGGREATSQELVHFELIDLALLMVIATVRFKSVVEGQKRLSKVEMESMLDSEEPLPSFLHTPFGDTSPKARQKGAVYALGEFLKRSDDIDDLLKRMAL